MVRAGVMDTLANYEFEPTRQVRRGELATTVSRLLSLIAAVKPELAKKLAGRPRRDQRRRRRRT